MANLLDYLNWRGDLTFEQVPLNEVDNVICAELVYLDWTGIVPVGWHKPVPLKEAAERCIGLHPYQKGALGLLLPDEIQDLMLAAARSPRFGGLLLSGFREVLDEHRDEQFAAMTLTLHPRLHYIAFRGTDDTVTGWKESFNLSWQFPIPAQEDALRYLNEAAAALRGNLFVGGHSKGGNLAVYASAFCSPFLQNRIQTIYNNDGPGFSNDQSSRSGYRRIRPRIHTLIPQSSVVGLLLEHAEDYQIVLSTNVGALQHDGLSWQVMGPEFVRAEKLTRVSEHTDQTLHGWVNSMNREARREFVERLFAFRDREGVHTLTQLVREPSKILPALTEAFDPETRDLLLKAFSQVLKEEHKGLGERLRDLLDLVDHKVGV